MRTRRFIILAGVLLAGQVWSLRAGAATAIGPLVTVSGPSPFAACHAGSAGTLYANAEVEPYVAVNPATVGTAHLNLVGVWQQDRWSGGAAHGLVAAYSDNGGKTWAETPLPFDVCAAPSDLTRASDPWVSIGPDGTVYAAGLVLNATWSTVAVATSTTGGKSWTNLHEIIRDVAARQFNDKESVTANPARPGVAYVVWDRGKPTAAAPASTYFSKTRDGGKTWSPPRSILTLRATGSGTVGNEVVVSPQTHTLFDVFAEGQYRAVFRRVCTISRSHRTCKLVRQLPRNPTTDYFVSVMRSTDGGKTWTQPLRIARVAGGGVPISMGGPFRTGGFLPEAAVDPATGRLYVVWEDGRFNNGRFSEIDLSRSTDGGLHWTAPQRINTPSGRAAFTPSIAVSDNGTVGVTYYDLRAGPTPGVPVPAQLWFTRSTDGGAHFGAEMPVAGPFDMHTAPDAGGYFLGDYQGLVATGTSFQPFFAAPNTGNLANRTDVFTATITP